MYKLIATDMDGTLLNNSQEIHKDNMASIKLAMEMGVKIVMCSGRSFMSIHKYEKELNLIHEDNFGIGFNGGMVYNTLTRKPLHELLLEKSMAVEILTELKRLDADLIVYASNKLLVEKESDSCADYAAISNMEVVKLDSLTDIDTDVSKIIAHGDRKRLLEIEEHMIKFLDGRCSSFFTGANFFEFTHINANKGNSLTLLANHLGIDMKDVIAVGDNYNDIEMLKQAGVGVAVKNAEQAVKDVADFVTETSNERVL
jgi:Cof subfamily protein (haloacid dehalogenase superfamily)